ncbi:MAG: DUF1592 domain-containing protein, partial [Planctomycetota bacterium]
MVFACCVIVLGWTSTARAVEPAGAAGGDAFAQSLQPFFAAYCLDCHTGDSAESGIDLSRVVTATQARASRGRWNQIGGLIRLHAMPPADYEPQPTAEERRAAFELIDQAVNQVDCQADPTPRHVTIRRLNTVEYDNTVRDLLAIDFVPSQLVGLPSDDVGNGFDNQGEVLTVSPLLLEKYLDAAEQITARAIVEDADTLRRQTEAGGRLLLGQSLERSLLFADGRYQLHADMRFTARGQGHKAEVQLLVDGGVVATVRVGHKQKRFSAPLDVRAGQHRVGVRFRSDPKHDPAGGRRGKLFVESLQIVGPRDAAPPYPRSHRQLFVATPGEGVTAAQAATQVFERLLPRAYRRPVTADEVQQIVRLVESAMADGLRFEAAVAIGVQATLASPHFLFRVEPGVAAGPGASNETAGRTPAGGGGKPGPRPLTGHELATRLSYFLWATMPDDRLFRLADSGQLTGERTLRQQAIRMLREPGAETLITRFFGQWLGLTGLEQVSPDPEKFPLWNGRLREAIRQETLRLCRDVLRDDRSLMHLFDADYTYINPRLAELYGVSFLGQDPGELYLAGPGQPSRAKRRKRSTRDGRYRLEDRWVRVRTGEGRRGVATHASVLALTSNPSSSSPVKRGRWVLDVVLGDSPPPAPPTVPSLEETAGDASHLSLREQLAIHRTSPSCAGCHKQMDPIGLGLENFDAIGRWRTEAGGRPVDPSGELNGLAFAGPGELLAIVRRREADIATNFVERLMTYALGR